MNNEGTTDTRGKTVSCSILKCDHEAIVLRKEDPPVHIHKSRDLMYGPSELHTGTFNRLAKRLSGIFGFGYPAAWPGHYERFSDMDKEKQREHFVKTAKEIQSERIAIAKIVLYQVWKCCRYNNGANRISFNSQNGKNFHTVWWRLKIA